MIEGMIIGNQEVAIKSGSSWSWSKMDVASRGGSRLFRMFSEDERMPEG